MIKYRYTKEQRRARAELIEFLSFLGIRSNEALEELRCTHIEDALRYNAFPHKEVVGVDMLQNFYRVLLKKRKRR